MIQWITTRPSGKAHTHSADDGVTGWRLHAVEADDKTTFAELGRKPSLCGLRPKMGWGMDLFIEARCKRCARKAAMLNP